ncbi:hypothetical protein RBB77_08340 [Tunturibacter psychrotolerans]|uniref:Uncharacterized protein n=1 Tax=Tunturiibacter psychrotolerans TaxID=3069686 RepID=A0AAU7ZVM5_9BACT
MDKQPEAGGHRIPLFWSERSDYFRLQREAKSFDVELALLEARDQPSDKSWASAARKELANVSQYLHEKNNVEGGWLSLHAARRHATLALNPEELEIRASILRAEAPKIASWRGREMLNLLSPNVKKPTVNHIISAMAIRDEYFSNQYHKIWLVGDQLMLLLISCFVAVLMVVPLVVFSTRHPYCAPAPWGYQMVLSVLFFGLLGAAFSAAGSLMRADVTAKIPERVSNQFVTSARAFFGSGTGLAGYAFYQSKLLGIQIGDNNLPGCGLAVAFLFGFAGERLIANVLGTLGAPQSHNNEEAASVTRR